MALTVETGAGIVGANSYVSVAEARTYATDRGLNLPAADADIEKLLIKSTDYVESFRERFRGTKANGPGYLQWPRLNVVIDGFEIGITTIPKQLKDAQCQLAFELQTVDPTPTTSGQVIKREKVDVIETEYAVNYKQGASPPSLPKVLYLLEPLLKWSGVLQSVRI